MYCRFALTSARKPKAKLRRRGRAEEAEFADIYVYAAEKFLAKSFPSVATRRVRTEAGWRQRWTTW